MAISLSGALEEDPEGVFAHSEGVRLPSWVGNVACADSSWEQVDMGSYLELSIGSHAPAPASLLSSSPGQCPHRFGCSKLALRAKLCGEMGFFFKLQLCLLLARWLGQKRWVKCLLCAARTLLATLRSGRPGQEARLAACPVLGVQIPGV